MSSNWSAKKKIEVFFRPVYPKKSNDNQCFVIETSMIVFEVVIFLTVITNVCLLYIS